MLHLYINLNISYNSTKDLRQLMYFHSPDNIHYHYCFVVDNREKFQPQKQSKNTKTLTWLSYTKLYF
jgi:hypothetical protein